MNNLENNETLLERPTRYIDEFNPPRQQARYSIESSYGYAERPDIARVSQQLHGACYVAFGYFTKDALEADGRLIPELDGTREDPDGIYTVSYLLAKHTETGGSGATLRLISAEESGGTYRDLPTGRYGLSEDAHEQIEQVVGENGVIREIAALAVAGKEHHLGSYELMRAVMQNALVRQSETGQREFYLASLTDVSLRPVVAFTGESATRLLGDSIEIFSSDDRAQDISVTPVLISPFDMIDAAIQSVEGAGVDTYVKNAERLAYLLDGLDARHIPVAAQQALAPLFSQK